MAPSLQDGVAVAAPDPGGSSWPGPVVNPPQIQLLTILRFFAAAWVLLFHLQAMFVLELPTVALHLVNNGAYAMSFFFVLSGTVLSYSYFRLGHDAAGLKRFYGARLARLYPVYALVHLVGMLWLPIPTSDLPRWIFVNAASFLGVQAWFPLAITGVNSGTWSVSCEFFFYLLFPALLPFFRNLVSPSQRIRTMIVLSAFIGFLGLADFAFARQGAFPLFYVSPLFRLAEFVLGMVVGVALVRRAPGARTSGWTVGVALVLVLGVSANPVYQTGMWTRANGIVVPAVAWFIHAVASFELSAPGRLDGVIWRVLEYLGRSSYCLFLVQMPMLLWLSTAYQERRPAAVALAREPGSSFVLFALAAIGLGIVLHETVEKPARRLIQRALAA